jgi:hypothetical protein
LLLNEPGILLLQVREPHIKIAEALVSVLVVYDHIAKLGAGLSQGV